jgi:type II secretion system protein I
MKFNTQRGGFTLLEVMIAMAIFCVAIFAILDLTTQNLRAARRLQNIQLDATSLAAAISLTNRLEDAESLPADVVAQFEEQNPGFTCTGRIYEVSTNGLFQIDLEVGGLSGKVVVGSTMSFLLYRPGSPSSFSGRVGLGRR